MTGHSIAMRVYRSALLLYPPSLRYEFGEEMLAVFGEDLQDACRRHNRRDVLRVWGRALYEILRIALPGQSGNAAVVVPALTFGLYMVALGARIAGSDGWPLYQKLGFGLLPGVVAAVTSSFAIRKFGSGGISLTGLQLSEYGAAKSE